MTTRALHTNELTLEILERLLVAAGELKPGEAAEMTAAKHAGETFSKLKSKFFRTGGVADRMYKAGRLVLDTRPLPRPEVKPLTLDQEVVAFLTRK